MKIRELVEKLETYEKVWGDVDVTVLIDGANGGFEPVVKVALDSHVGVFLETE